MRHYDSINAIEINFLNVRLGSPVFFKQYDNDNILEIQILQNDTEWVLTNETVNAFFLLPDGTTLLEKNATIVNGNAHIVIDNNILSQSGTMYMELTVVSTTGEISTSPRTTMSVEATFDRNGAAQTVVQWDILTEIQTIKSMFNALTVAGNNLLKNSDFKSSGYLTIGAGWAKDTTTVIDKSADSYTISRTGLGSDTPSNFTSTTNVISAKQNEIYTFSIWVYTPNSSLIDGGGIKIYIAEYNSSSAYLSNSTPFALSFTANNTWQRFTITHTAANAACAYIKPVITMYRNGTVSITKPLFEKNNKPSDWKLNNLDAVERKLDAVNSLNNSSIKTDTTGFALDTGWTRDTLVYRNTNAYPFKISRTGLGADSLATVYTGHSASYNPTVAALGESWVASIWVMSPDITAIDSTSPYLIIRGRDASYTGLESAQVNIKPSQSNVWERFYVPITMTNASVARVSMSTAIYRNGTLYTSEPQLEKGIFPTDWKQSVADLAAASGSINADTLDTYHASSFVLKGDQMINVKDYGALGDGSTNDSTAIQSALDALGATGGTLLFPKGTYMLGAALQVPNYCKLQGIGSATIKRGAAINNLLRNKSDGVTGGYLANNNITLENLVFDGNASVYGATSCTNVTFGHCTDILIKECTFKSLYDWHLLEINGSKNIKVENCKFYDYAQGVGTTSATEMLQLDIAKSATEFPWFAPYDNTSCQGITITNNWFYGSTTPSYREDIIAIGNHTYLDGITTKHVIICNNIFELVNKGVKLNDTKYMTIGNNEFKNCDYAVYISDRENEAEQNGCFEITITGNNYYGNYINGSGNSLPGRFVTINPGTGEYPILTQFVNISNNTIDNCHEHGISGTWQRGSIIGNQIMNCGKNGIYLYGGTRYIVTGNVILGTSLHPVGEGTFYSMQLGNNTNEALDNSIIQGNNCDKILVSTSTTGTHILIVGNILTNGLTNSGAAVVKQNIINGSYAAG